MRLRKIFCLIILCILLNCSDVFASTKVNTRTDSDYLVPRDIVVTNSNRKAILSTPAINAEEKIYDFAEILTDDEEEKLYKQIFNFIYETNMDMAIVTIKDNPVGSTKDYAHNFYQYNFFKDDGLLFLIDFYESEIYMTTSGKAYNLFPDSRMQPILKNVYNKIMKKNFYEACSTFVNSIGGFVGIGEATKGEDVVIDVDGTVHKESWIIEALVFAGIGTLIGMVVLVSMNKMVKPATTARSFLEQETVVIKDIRDNFIDAKTTRRRRNKS